MSKYCWNAYYEDSTKTWMHQILTEVTYQKSKEKCLMMYTKISFSRRCLKSSAPLFLRVNNPSKAIDLSKKLTFLWGFLQKWQILTTQNRGKVRCFLPLFVKMQMQLFLFGLILLEFNYSLFARSILRYTSTEQRNNVHFLRNRRKNYNQSFGNKFFYDL